MLKNSSELVLGIDIGTNGVRVAVFELDGSCISFHDAPLRYETPQPGWAEQSPDDWWMALCTASRGCIAKGGIDPARIIGIGADATSCTIIPMDRNMEAIRPAIMWMDIRASSQAMRIMESGHPALKCNGFGNVSAEWLPCKALWLKECEERNYSDARYIFECIDWLTYRLTGSVTASINTASIRGYYDNSHGGWPDGFYSAVGLDDLTGKLPQTVLKLGEEAGRLTIRAADEMGLVPGIPVGQGGVDGHVAMIGLDVVAPQKFAVVTGSSHTHLTLSKKELHSQGVLGSYPDAVIPGYELVEGGQISTGSIVSWFMRNLRQSGACAGAVHADPAHIDAAYDDINAQASKLPIGSEGLISLDYFQGNRTPYSDSDTRGMIYGLTLKHSAAHIYRSIIEGICYGTRQIIEEFNRLGLSGDALYICGGACRSRFWLQAHADVCNMPVMVPEIIQAPVLGSAILGAVAGGAYDRVSEASHRMVRYTDRIEPNADAHGSYMFYYRKYTELYPLLKDWMHSISRHVADSGPTA